MKKRAGFERLARSECGEDRVVILHRVAKLVFVHRISLESSKPGTRHHHAALFNAFFPAGFCSKATSPNMKKSFWDQHPER